MLLRSELGEKLRERRSLVSSYGYGVNEIWRYFKEFETVGVMKGHVGEDRMKTYGVI